MASIELISPETIKSIFPFEKAEEHRQRGLNPTHPYGLGLFYGDDAVMQANQSHQPYYDAVPDNVQAAMAKGGYVLGGEQSGHIILGEFAATGDGLLASVYLASTIKKTKLPLSVLSKVTRYPQINASFAVKNKSEVVRNKDLQNYVSAIKGELPEGRILIRESGTEEKIRLTVEAKDEEIMNNAFKKMSKYIKEKFM